MRHILTLCALTLLAGCSTVSALRDAWHWDPTRPQEDSRVELSPAEAATLTNRLAELQLQRDAIRSRISAEPDIRARQALYSDLHRVGQQLSPLERRLALAAPAR
jgi:hypothetical protein